MFATRYRGVTERSYRTFHPVFDRYECFLSDSITGLGFSPEGLFLQGLKP